VDIEVVVTALPELFLVGESEGLELAGGQLLEDLEKGGEGSDGGFVGEEMDVLGHQDVGRDAELLLLTGLFEDLLGDVFGGVGFEEGLPAVTTEGDEVEVLSLLVALEAGGHGSASSSHLTLREKREGWGTRRTHEGIVCVPAVDLSDLFCPMHFVAPWTLYCVGQDCFLGMIITNVLFASIAPIGFIE
jgi:hypothetical protein